MLRYTFRQLEYLIACIDTGSLVAAAQKLNVSQPSVSTAIAKLEDQIGAQLLIRHHAQGVVPTADAKPIILAARNLLAHANDFQNSIEELKVGLKGDINLGSFFPLAPTYLPGLISSLGDEYPDLHFNISEGSQDQLINGLRNGDFEAALMYDSGLPSDLEKQKLIELNPHVLLQKGHALAKQDTVSLFDLENLPLILLDIPPSRQYFTGLFEAQGLKPVINHRTSSLELVRGLVGRGLGYSLLVTRPHGDITYDGQLLDIRPIKECTEKSIIVLCRPSSVRHSRAMQIFEKFAVDHFRNLAQTAAN